MDPIQYIESLYQDWVDDYGCIKIIPPAGFKPPSPIDKDSPNKLPSRFQTLQNLTQGIVSCWNSEISWPEWINFHIAIRLQRRGHNFKRFYEKW